MIDLKEKLLSSFIAFENQTNIDSYAHEVRSEAIKQFESIRFPNKKLENWKYTSLKNLLNTDYTVLPEINNVLEFKNIKKYGGSPKHIYVSGHSAGGYLTSMVGLDKRWLAAHKIDANAIAGLIPYSGHTITHFTVRKERGIDGKQPILDDMAPLFHVRKDAPPLLLITGDRELEMLGRYEENAYMWRMMQVVEHPDTKIMELDGYNHGQMAKPAHPLLLRFIKRIEKTLK